MANTVSSKGQVTIPKRVRDRLGLRPGAEVEFVFIGGHAVLEPVRGGAAALAGSLHAYARNLKGKSGREVMEEVRNEVADEAARKGLPSRHQRRS